MFVGCYIWSCTCIFVHCTSIGGYCGDRRPEYQAISCQCFNKTMGSEARSSMREIGAHFGWEARKLGTFYSAMFLSSHKFRHSTVSLPFPMLNSATHFSKQSSPVFGTTWTEPYSSLRGSFLDCRCYNSLPPHTNFALPHRRPLLCPDKTFPQKSESTNEWHYPPGVAQNLLAFELTNTPILQEYNLFTISL